MDDFMDDFFDPKNFSDPGLGEAVSELHRLSQDPEVRRAYEDYLKYENDAINARSHARNEGKKEGIAIGEERGLTKGKREAALTMLSDGVSIASISKYTGLSLSEIESLNQ